MATAILVDGAFFLRRFKHCFPDHDREDARSVAHGLGLLAYWHLSHRLGPAQLMEQISKYNLQLAESVDFYRIFFYDCSPLTKRMHRPLSQKSVDWGKTPEASFRLELHKEVRKLRKVAVRLGPLNDTSRWRLSETATNRLIRSPNDFVATDDDFEVDTKQRAWICALVSTSRRWRSRGRWMRS